LRVASTKTPLWWGIGEGGADFRDFGPSILIRRVGGTDSKKKKTKKEKKKKKKKNKKKKKKKTTPHHQQKKKKKKTQNHPHQKQKKPHKKQTHTENQQQHQSFPQKSSCCLLGAGPPRVGKGRKGATRHEWFLSQQKGLVVGSERGTWTITREKYRNARKESRKNPRSRKADE